MSVIPIQSFKLTAQKLWQELSKQTCPPEVAILQKFLEKAVILLKHSKRQLHVYSNTYTQLISQKLWKELITQTCHPVVAIFFKKNILKFEKAVILSQMICSFPKGRCISTVCLYDLSKLQIDCSKSVVEVDYTDLTSCTYHYSKNLNI